MARSVDAHGTIYTAPLLRRETETETRRKRERPNGRSARPRARVTGDAPRPGSPAPWKGSGTVALTSNSKSDQWISRRSAKIQKVWLSCVARWKRSSDDYYLASWERGVNTRARG